MRRHVRQDCACHTALVYGQLTCPSAKKQSDVNLLLRPRHKPLRLVSSAPHSCAHPGLISGSLIPRPLASQHAQRTASAILILAVRHLRVPAAIEPFRLVFQGFVRNLC